MDSKLDKLRKQAEKLGIELDANETIADLEAKIAVAKNGKGIKSHGNGGGVPKEGTYLLKQNETLLQPPRRKPVKHINFTRRIDREAKNNG